MPRRGRQLEQLVEMIERSIGQRDNVIVESPKYLPDLVTGEQREFDVVVSIKGGHHEVMIGIECKDWQRAVDVPAVEQFVGRCEGTPVHHRVMVSASGFTKPALAKAAAKKVRCLTLREVQAFDWAMIKVIVYQDRRITDVQLSVIPAEETTSAVTLCTEDGSSTGRPVDRNEMLALANKRFSEFPPGDSRRLLEIDLDAARLFLTTDEGRRIAVQRAAVRVTIDVKTTMIPWEFREYVDVGSGVKIARLGNISIETADGEMHIVAVEDSGSADFQISGRFEPRKKD